MDKKHHKHVYTILILLLAFGVAVMTGRKCMRAEPSPLDTSAGGYLGILIQLIYGPDDGNDGDSSLLTVAVGDNDQVYRAQLSGGSGNWSAADLSGDSSLSFKAVTWTGQNFVAVGGDGSSCAIYYSADGASWQAATHPSCTSNLLDAETGNDLVIASGHLVGGPLPGVLVSGDHGVTWSQYSGINTSAYVELGFDGTYFVAADNSGGITRTYRSTDGQSWATTPDATPLGSAYPATYSAMHRVGDGSLFIVAGAEGSMMPSPKSSVHTTNSLDSCSSNAVAIFGGTTTSTLPYGLASSDTRLVAVGQNCAVDYTDDMSGLTWSGSLQTMNGCSGATDWNDLSYIGGYFIAVGKEAGGQSIVAGSVTGEPGDWTIQSIGNDGINSVAVRN